jgi:hypothetical protein
MENKIITKLTKTQEKQIPKFIEKYVDMAKQPTDKKKATRAIQNLYKYAGFDKPIVIYAESPFAAVVMAAVTRILVENKLLSNTSKLGSQLHSKLGSQLHSQLYSQLYSQLHSQLDSKLYSQLHSQLYSQLDSQLDSKLDSKLYSQLSKINNDWWLIIWWLIWAGWYEFAKYIGVKFDNKIFKIFMDFVTNVSFIIPYEGIAFVSETPKTISWDNKRLSNKNAPAVEYKDGYALYCIDGVDVSEKIVMHPETLTKKDWIEEENTEVRRIIQDQMKERFVTEVGGKLIAKHKNNKIGEIIEIDISPDPEKFARYIHAQDWSTNRMYFVRIPPTISDPIEAQKWVYDWPENTDFKVRYRT